MSTAAEQIHYIPTRRPSQGQLNRAYAPTTPPPPLPAEYYPGEPSPPPPAALDTQSSTSNLRHAASTSTLGGTPQKSTPNGSSTIDRQADAMATLKLRRLTNLNNRLRKELVTERVPASRACDALIQYTLNAHEDPALRDYCVPEVYGPKPPYFGADGLPTSGVGVGAGAGAGAGSTGAPLYYENEEKTLLSPISAQFSSKGGQGCCVIS